MKLLPQTQTSFSAWLAQLFRQKVLQLEGYVQLTPSSNLFLFLSFRSLRQVLDIPCNLQCHRVCISSLIHTFLPVFGFFVLWILLSFCLWRITFQMSQELIASFPSTLYSYQSSTHNTSTNSSSYPNWHSTNSQGKLSSSKPSSTVQVVPCTSWKLSDSTLSLEIIKSQTKTHSNSCLSLHCRQEMS